MSRLRPKVSISAKEAEALEAHPEFAGSLGALIRTLALRQIGLTPSDPYAAHRTRPRDEKGRMKRMLTLRDFTEIEGGEDLVGPGGIRLEWGLINQHDCTSGWYVRGAGRELAQERFQSAQRAIDAINAVEANK